MNRKSSKSQKCEFRTSQILFFGVIIGANGISPDPLKVEVNSEFCCPETVKDLKGFLARFLKDYAKIFGPLRTKTTMKLE